MGAFIFMLVTFGLPAFGIYWYMWGRENRIIPKAHVAEVDGKKYTFTSKKRQWHDIVYDYYLHHEEQGIPDGQSYGLWNKNWAGPSTLDGHVI